MKTTPWTGADIPAQSGRLAIITGTGGLGYETALALARAGAEVILAGRNPAKGEAAVAAIRAAHPGARIAFAELDLGRLASVAAFAERFGREHDALDLLINNAGVMTPPTRQLTADGFELQFGTNHLGHFALTGHLLPSLRRGRTPRVVQVSSAASRMGGAIHFDDLQSERRYSPWRGYTQSKLANLLFAFELQRRSDANGWGLMSNAAHPGYARTELIANGPGERGPGWHLNRLLLRWWMSQSAADGALPTLFAATAPEARNSGYYGPGGWQEMTGLPAPAIIPPRAKDLAVARRLWEISEQLSGVRWPARQS
ncbi:MAG: oxidoreductase [Verrucomicrobiota bacterium]